MLEIYVPDTEYYDEARSEFVSVKGQALKLEHSLVSLSKWEARHHKPFLTNDEKSEEEVLDYVQCMTITQNVNPLIYRALTRELLTKIQDYIGDPMTATWFSNKENRRFNREIITAEIIYYWMVTLQIPFECEKWHLNRLLTLVRVCNEKNAPEKKMSKSALAAQNRALNAARRQRMRSKG